MQTTHGDLISRIYTMFSELLFKSKLRRQRRRMRKLSSLFDKVAIGNEFTETKDRYPYSHSHMYVKTGDMYSFKDMKKLIKKYLGVKCTDIQRPLNYRECVRYVTKEDTNAVVINIPLKYTSTIFRARVYYENGHQNVSWADAIPYMVSASDRNVTYTSNTMFFQIFNDVLVAART